MSKTLKTRIINKSDTSANWAKATTFIPLKGELIIYSDTNQMKIGDGVTKVNDLPFFDTIELIDLVQENTNSPIGV